MIHELNISPTMNPKVLIIDDCLDSVRILSNILAHYKCEISLAFDGQDAIPLLQGQDYDLIVLDWNMPKMAGNEFLMTMEQIQPARAHRRSITPVLLYTASAQSDLMLPESRRFRYVGCIDKAHSFSAKFRSIGNALALI